MNGALSARVIVSIVRTVAYGGLAGFFAFCSAAGNETLDALLVGGVMADYLTWLIRSALLLPSHILHGSYDCCVNVLFGWYMWRFVLPQTHLQGQAMGLAFLAFLLVLSVKIAYYGVEFVEEDEE